MALQWREYRSRFAGLGCWLVDFALQLAGLVLIGLRGSIPDFLSLAVGNAMIVCGFVFLNQGLRLFLKRGGSIVADCAVFAVFMAAYSFFSIARPSLGARESVFSLALIYTSARGLWIITMPRTKRRSVGNSTALVLAAFCLASLGRIGISLSPRRGEDLFAPATGEAVILMLYMVLFVALTFSLVFMIGARLSREHESAMAEKGKAEAELRASEEKFSKAFQASPDAMVISRLDDGRYIEVNDSFTRISGYSREEALGNRPLDVWGDPGKREALISELVGRSFIKGRDIAFIGKGGRVIHADYSGGVIELEGEPHLLSIVRDLTERDRAAAILRVRLELREYAAAHSVEELTTKALEAAEEITGSRIGFYHQVDESQGILTRQAWSARTLSEFCKDEGGSSHYPLSLAGVWADCIREKRPVIHNDYAALPHKRGLPEAHPAIERELVAPAMREGKVVAILGVGNKEADYDEEDATLASYIVDLLWAIAEKKKADERILALNERLEQLAMTDELTGMANRRAFFAFGRRALQESSRYGTSLSFIMLDLDHFKQVNDLWGHDSGDAVLKMTARVIREQVREVDISARLGGEEFGLLMPNTGLEEALLTAERLRAAIAEASYEREGRSLRVTASLGVSAFGCKGEDLDDIMRKADEAMYRAKSEGRDRVASAS